MMPSCAIIPAQAGSYVSDISICFNSKALIHSQVKQFSYCAAGGFAWVVML